MTAGPYAEAADAYWATGWRGVIPIPLRSKKLRVAGWTGENGTWPSYPDVRAWADSESADEGGGNIVLRLPHHIIGVDVDDYDNKSGGATLDRCVEQWGPLPDTWRSTSRDDGVSGIRLYAVPEGLAWPGNITPGIEIIQYRHRYAVVWPSIHPEGRTYRWITPGGVVSTVVPHVDELPELPDEWIVGLTGGEMATPSNKVTVTVDGTQSWLLAAPTGQPCRRMQAATTAAVTALGAGSRHEAAMKHQLRLVRLAEQGHPGVVTSIGNLHSSFIAEATTTGRGEQRTHREAEAEWIRGLTGAVGIVVGNPGPSSDTSGCECDDDLVGLIDRGGLAVFGSNALAFAPPAVVSPVEAAPDPAAVGHDTDQQPDEERTSWWPRDLTGVISGHETEPQPVVLLRDDRQPLFYAGKVNGLLGESESGKTWVILLGVTQELAEQRQVLYIDCEDTAPGIVGRLRCLGVTDTDLAGLDYIGPEESLHALASADLAETLAAATYSLIVLDGVNAAMTLLGLELESNTDATRFAQLLLRPLARTGAAVVTVDHVPKNKETRGKGGIGAQAKRAMVTGCALLVDVATPFGRGSTGRLRLYVDKDRPGYVRGASGQSRYTGTAVLVSDPESGDVTVTISPPDDRAPGDFRPTRLMERISVFLGTLSGGDGVSGAEIEKYVTGNRDAIRRALNVLVEEEYVSRLAGPRNAVLHRFDRPYQQLSDLIGDGEDASDD